MPQKGCRQGSVRAVENGLDEFGAAAAQPGHGGFDQDLLNGLAAILKNHLCRPDQCRRAWQGLGYDRPQTVGPVAANEQSFRRQGAIGKEQHGPLNALFTVLVGKPLKEQTQCRVAFLGRGG